jgi:c-di-GMP-binding flagellar brake protein YcgR
MEEKMNHEDSLKERRRYKRIDKKFNATYKVISDAADNGSLYKLPQKREAESANFSPAGVQLLIDGVKLDLSQIVGIEMKLDQPEKNIKTFAEVRWTAYDDMNRKFRTGFEFIAIKDEDRATLEDMAKQ